MSEWTCDSEHKAPNERIPAAMQCLAHASIPLEWKLVERMASAE
jgi:hypothetical protein